MTWRYEDRDEREDRIAAEKAKEAAEEEDEDE